MNDRPELSVAILAGGLGTRLRPAVADRPKVLAPVGGRPYLAHLLHALSQYGIREVVLLVGHRADMVWESLGDCCEGVRLRYSIEASPLGTGGAVRLALPLLHSSDVLLLNGDSFAEVDLPAFQDEHSNRSSDASLVLARVPDAGRFGSVRLDGRGRVVRFAEKTESGEGWINAGVYLLSRRLIAEIPRERPISLERDLIPEWVRTGILFGFRTPGRFIDIGTPESYACAEDFFARVGAGV